ncbi:MAG: tetratricopeptide repeat protein, partial [Gemmatimonadales bacterium]
VVLPGPVGVDPEATVRAFPAITGPIPGPTSAPTFNAAIEPLERAPEPLPLAPLSEEAQVERTASEVRPMAALEPTSYEDDATDTAPTERMAGIDPTGLSDAEVAGIGATSGFEPTSGPQDMTDLPRTSVIGLETISGDLVFDQLAAAGVEGLEREQDIELGGTVSNEFQEDSVAETLRRRSGANEFQVPSDADTLNAASARASEAIETGGIDLAFIEPDEVVAPPKAAKFTPAPLVPEELEPAVAEPEPVVTEAMADLYASQGHLAEALDVYRQLSARSPADPRYADRIVELEMFVGGSAPTRPESARSETVDSLDQMEIVAPTGDGGHAPASAPPAPRITVGVWLADVFAEALPAEEPAAPAPAPAPVEAPPVSDVAPRGAPTRPASGSFSLSNVFGEERPGKATAKSGSFDDFFGSPAASPPAAPSGEPGRSTTRSTRPSGSATPPADDDLSSFQDWLKGLKK